VSEMGVIGRIIGRNDPHGHSANHPRKPEISSPDWMSLRGHGRPGALAPEGLAALRRVATIESIGSSTRMEGSKLSDRQVEWLLSNVEIKSFETRDEQEVAGYAETMELLFQSWGRSRSPKATSSNRIATCSNTAKKTRIIAAITRPNPTMESVIEQSKEGYYLALRQTQATVRTDAPNWQPWVMFFLRALQQQMKCLVKKVEREKIVLAALPELSVRIIAAGMEAERHQRRRLPCQQGPPEVLLSRACALEDTATNTRLEDYCRGLFLEFACVGNNRMSGGGPPHAEIGCEVSESLFGRACHRYGFHDWLNRDGLGCHNLSFLLFVGGANTTRCFFVSLVCAAT
jgi:hypothetical protein